MAFITGHCHLNRHQALIDDAETEQIRKHVGNEDEDGNSIIPPADPTCSMCRYDPSQANKEETPLHLMTECVGLKDLRRKVFGAYNPVPPFKFPVFQIVAFLKEAKIPSFPMQPFLEELFPTAPTGVPDPDPVPDPQPSPQTPPPSPDTELVGGIHPCRQIDDPIYQIHQGNGIRKKNLNASWGNSTAQGSRRLKWGKRRLGFSCEWHSCETRYFKHRQL